VDPDQLTREKPQRAAAAAQRTSAVGPEIECGTASTVSRLEVVAEQLTLVLRDGPIPAAAPAVPDGYRLRGCRPGDIEALGRLYFASYDPGQACANLNDATADIQASFAGEYGPLFPAASMVATTGPEQIVAAILVVTRAPWPHTPDCPFVIELFTGRAHRRRGLARCLIQTAAQVIADHTGHRQLALRVSTTNHPARSLYHQLGFTE
jgi:GNAT superfamily N-acetyltransferase